MTTSTRRARRARRARNTFTKIGGSTYACVTCGRQTRNTGAQALGSKTCPQCYDLAGIENEIADGHATLAEYREQVDALLAEIREKGGNPDESFAGLLPVVVEPTPAAAAVAAAHADAPEPGDEVEPAYARYSDDARGYVQTIPSAVLAAAVRGEVDLQALASAELASRGRDAAGTWVGFPAAQAAHAARTPGAAGAPGHVIGSTPMSVVAVVLSRLTRTTRDVLAEVGRMDYDSARVGAALGYLSRAAGELDEAAKVAHAARYEVVRGDGRVVRVSVPE